MKRLFALFLCLCFVCPPVRCAQPESLVALTFDDGPSGRFTRRLLQGLAERNVCATFLLCGYRMEVYPQLTKQIFDVGHEIGLHGYSHQAMHTMSRQQLRREIRDTLALLPEDCHPAFLRPPGGQCGTVTTSTALEMDLPLLCWSVDPRDWETNDVKTIVDRVLRQTSDGDVILLHDMSDSSVTAALEIVDRLQARGFRFVTVSQLAKAKGVQPQPGQVYCRFG